MATISLAQDYQQLGRDYAVLATQYADLACDHEDLLLRYRFLEELFKQALRRVVTADALVDAMTGRSAWPESAS